MGYLPRSTYRKSTSGLAKVAPAAHRLKDSTFHKLDHGHLKEVGNTRFEEVNKLSDYLTSSSDEHNKIITELNKVNSSHFSFISELIRQALVNKISQGLVDVKKGVRIGTQCLLGSISADVEEMHLERYRWFFLLAFGNRLFVVRGIMILSRISKVTIRHIDTRSWKDWTICCKPIQNYSTR